MSSLLWSLKKTLRLSSVWYGESTDGRLLLDVIDVNNTPDHSPRCVIIVTVCTLTSGYLCLKHQQPTYEELNDLPVLEIVPSS